MTPQTVTCPRCGRTSHHPDDVAEGYCGACHDYTSLPRHIGLAEVPPGPAPSQPGADAAARVDVADAAARVVRRVTQHGAGPGLTREQIGRLAVEWAPLAGALAELMAVSGAEPPAEWRLARRRWGGWR